jgi:hypothetical protein
VTEQSAPGDLKLQHEHLCRSPEVGEMSVTLRLCCSLEPVTAFISHDVIDALVSSFIVSKWLTLLTCLNKIS